MFKEISLLFCLCFLSYAKVELEAYLQPLYSLEQKGSFGKSGTANWGFHRLKTEVYFVKTVDEKAVRAHLSVDFSEKEFPKGLKNAYVELAVNKAFNIRMGQFKSPFGFESARSSKKMSSIYRGEITQYIREDCGVGGYLAGGEIYGEIIPQLKYSLSFFNANGFSTVGGNKKDYINRFFGAPVGRMRYNINKMLSLNYTLAIPYYGAVVLGSESLGKRHLLQDFALSFDVKRYCGAIELFIGADTSNTKRYLPYTTNNTDGLSQGISFTNEFAISHNQNLRSIIWGRFEYLNGLSFNGLTYANRSYYYSLAAGFKVLYLKNFSLNVGIDEKFDVDFKKINDLRLAIECTALFKKVFKKKTDNE